MHEKILPYLGTLQLLKDQNRVAMRSGRGNQLNQSYMNKHLRNQMHPKENTRDPLLFKTRTKPLKYILPNTHWCMCYWKELKSSVSKPCCCFMELQNLRDLNRTLEKSVPPAALEISCPGMCPGGFWMYKPQPFWTACSSALSLF